MGKRAFVIGLGKSGVWATRLLLESGYEVFATDENVDSAGSLSGCRKFHFVGDPDEAVNILREKDYSFVVVSPGVPPSFGPYRAALERASLKSFMERKPGKPPVISEVELAILFQERFLGYAPAYIGITGTNGKSTAVDLTAGVLKSVFLPAYPAGNFGEPLSKIFLEGPKVHYYVLELSSYQLERTFSLNFLSSVVLNITPDHLYRYSSMEEYAEAKMRIHENSSFRLLNLDDEYTLHLLSSGFLRKVFPKDDVVLWGYSLEEKYRADSVNLRRSCMHLRDGCFFFEGYPFLAVRDLSDHLKLKHNLSNLLAVFSLLVPVIGNYKNLPPYALASLKEFLYKYRGLPHRVEEFLEVNFRGINVKFYDDSKSTNPDSVGKAVGSFDVPVLLLMGGQKKEADYSELFKRIERSSVFKVILFGGDRHALGDAIKRSGVAVDYVLAESFGELPDLIKEALLGFLKDFLSDKEFLPKFKNNCEVAVLFSPGCASFDSFSNFEERGRVFKEMIKRSFKENS